MRGVMALPRLEPDGFTAKPTSRLVAVSPADRIEKLEGVLERLLPRLRIAVIFGGDKSADGAVIHPTVNPRPWKSYEAVARDIADALTRIGFRHVHLIPEDMRLGDRLRHEGIHIAWLNTGGVQGYNPTCHAAAMLEMFGIPYLGHEPLAAGTLDNKHIFKRELVSLGIASAPFMTWHPARGPFRPEMNVRFHQIFGDHCGPFVVKPVSGRASLHVHFVEDVADLPDAVAEVYHATENLVLIESYLPGPEFCVTVCGPVIAQGGRLRLCSEPFVFSAIERAFEPNERIFTSMDLRPINADRFRVLDSVGDAALIAQLEELARAIFLEFNLESIIRLDLRANVAGRLCILEANPKPDLKRPTNEATNLACAGLWAQNMDYDDLILSLLADRLDFLFNYRRRAIQHLTALTECPSEVGTG